MASVVDVWRFRSSLRFLVQRDLALKYQSSFLGYLWSLIEPLMMGAIYYFVFGVLFGERTAPEGGGPPYIIYLLSGIFAYMWVTGTLGETTGALVGQKNLITTMNVPREVFPVARVIARFAEYAAGLPVLLVAAFAFGAEFSWWLLTIPFAVLLQGIFLIGIGLLLSAVNVMLRDIERFMRLAQRMLFYGSPIIYQLSTVTDELPDWAALIYQANPLVGIFELHHAAWYPQVFPSPGLLATSIAGSLITLGFGWWVFHRLEPAVLKEL